MKNTPSNPNATTSQQNKDSRQNPGPGAGTDRAPTNAASSSQQATERAKRGEPVAANKKSERSPKQENL
jgi:hypothetical protein